MRLAKEITEKGYFRHEALIVVQEGSKWIVYEGNRRLCALKLLKKPELAPPQYVASFKRLSVEARVPSKVEIMIVGNKFEAEVVMHSKHTGVAFIQRWKPLQQAAFIAGKIEAGDSDEAISSGFGLSATEIVESRALVDLYRVCRAAPLTLAARALVDDPGEFPTSVVFDRLIRPPSTREALGIEMTDQGLVFHSSMERFLTIIAKILDDVARKELDTRVLDTTEDQKAYVAALKFKKGSGSFTAADIASSSSASASGPGISAEAQRGDSALAPDELQRKRDVRPSQYLFASDITIDFPHDKLHALIREGKRLPVVKFEHTCIGCDQLVMCWIRVYKHWESDIGNSKFLKFPSVSASLAVEFPPELLPSVGTPTQRTQAEDLLY